MTSIVFDSDDLRNLHKELEQIESQYYPAFVIDVRLLPTPKMPNNFLTLNVNVTCRSQSDDRLPDVCAGVNYVMAKYFGSVLAQKHPDGALWSVEGSY